MMGMVEPDDLEDTAAIVDEHGRAVNDAATPEDAQLAQLKETVKAAFDYMPALRCDARVARPPRWEGGAELYSLASAVSRKLNTRQMKISFCRRRLWNIDLSRVM
jgi:hypothetical protein